MSAYTPDTALAAELTAGMLEVEHARAERVLNGVRAAVLAVMAAAAGAYASELTPALRAVNAAVLLPMMAWTLAQHALVHRPRRAPRWLSIINAVIDVTAITALLAGYGLWGHPDLVVRSPIVFAYFAILASRPFTSAARHAAVVAALVVAEYAALLTLMVRAGGMQLHASPLDVLTHSGGSMLDEGAKLVLLAVVGGIATYATAWTERTMRLALASQVKRDAEERALAARLQEADKLAAVGTLMASVAHEVSNPLATIGLYAELLRGSPLSEKQREDVTAIIEEARRTGSVLRDLLGVARARDGAEAAPLSLPALAEHALAVLRPLFASQHVTVERDLPPHLPDVRGLENRLEQVVLNLLINAVHAMESSTAPRMLRVSAGEDAAAGRVWLAVEDTGAGLPAGVGERIFERFFSTKPAGKGTGLGLWIARQIVSEHAGTITAANAPDGGARFVLEFPALERAAESVAA